MPPTSYGRLAAHAQVTPTGTPASCHARNLSKQGGSAQPVALNRETLREPPAAVRIGHVCARVTDDSPR